MLSNKISSLALLEKVCYVKKKEWILKNGRANGGCIKIWYIPHGLYGN